MDDDWAAINVENTTSIREFIETIQFQRREMVLTSKGKTVGAILTAEQYHWFLDQLDAQSDTSFIEERDKDLEGAQSLEDLKKVWDIKPTG